MTAVIYARYSSDNQREESIEGQIRECTAYAEKNGITIVKHYIDRAISAKTDNRPEFQQMIKDSDKKLFDIVLVWKLDRFARNRYDSARYKTQLLYCTKSSTLWGAALFVLHGFYGAVKERIRTARAPRFASRGAETPRWGVSRARLGKFPSGTQKSALQCTFAMRFFYSDFRIILAAYHLRHQCIALLPAVHFSVDLQWYT